MKIILAVLFALSICFALDHTTTTYIPLSGASISASGNKANFDSLRNGINQVKDTVVRDHDSLKTRVVRAVKAQFDTLLGKPTYMKGRVIGDTIAGTFSSATNGNFTNLTYDSAGGRIIKASGPITADSVNVRAIKATNLSTDSLISTVKSFPCSLFDGATYRAKVTATYKSIAGIVSITIPNLIGSLAGGGPCYIRTIPAEIRPAATKQVICIVVDNGTLRAGMIYPANNAQFTVSDILGTGCVSGTSGIAGTTCVIYNLY
jgi:hypothetical protein